MKKLLILLAVLGFLGGGTWFVWRYYARSAAPAADAANSAPTEAQVKRGSLRVTVEATGRVVPAQEVEIKCKASGEIIELPVDISNPVQKGSLLLRLDPAEEERSVRRAEASLAVSDARLAQAKLSLQVAERNLDSERKRATSALASSEARSAEAKAKLERAAQLMEKKMSSPEELESARTASIQAEADLESAKARIEDIKTQEIQLEKTKQDIKIAEAQVESDRTALTDAKQRLADTTVNSPIDGVVATRNVQFGQIIASGINNVGGGTTVMTLADLSQVFVLVAVDESDIGRIEAGQPAAITVDAFPDAFFPGEVVRVATKGSSSSNVVTFEVKVEVKGPSRRLLKPEMTANVSITAVDRQDVLLVPASAVERRRRERFVNVKKPGGGEPEQRKVETGATDGESIEITSGLEEGETVALPKAGEGGGWRRDSQSRDQARQQGMRNRMFMGGPRR